MKHQPFFLDIDPATAADPTVPYAVLPIPYERSVTFGTGTAKGPESILIASHEIEDFDEEYREPMDLAVQTLPTMDLEGASDEEAIAEIQKAAQAPASDGRFLLGLGGEHTVTLPLVRAAHAIHSDVSILQIDAHSDLRDQYLGNKLSHACVMRRLRELDYPTVHASIRSMSSEEYDYVQSESVPVFWGADMINNQEIDSQIVSSLSMNVYITIDIDALDSSIAPGTGTPEPGGLGWHRLLSLLRKVFESHNVIGADIVEVAPIPGSQVTQFTAARLGAKMLMYHKKGCKP